MGTIKIVTDATFTDEVLLSEKPVLVDFWAEWCGPCKKILPILEEISATQDAVTIAKVNIDENPQTGTTQQIMSLPTLKIYHEGRVVRQLSGARSKAAILAELQGIA